MQFIFKEYSFFGREEKLRKKVTEREELRQRKKGSSKF